MILWWNRSYDDEYETEGLPLGYIAYKVNTCAPAGKRDLSAYAGEKTINW